MLRAIPRATEACLLRVVASPPTIRRLPRYSPMRLLLLSFLFLFTACSSPAAIQTVAEDADCNLSTPLVPGVPGSPGNLIKSSRNPNGDSELSALMRMFVDDLRNARTLAEAGEKVPAMFATHRKMRCAWPTKPEERHERFDTLAQGDLAAVRAFDAEPKKATFNSIIDGCVNCHSHACGGPLEFIDGMRWQ